MSEDKELLELAAKAAGFTTFCVWSEKITDHDSPHYGLPALHQGCFGGEANSWNPNESDRDALRLAVTLNIAIEPRDDTGEVFATFMGATCGSLGMLEICEPFGDDKYAATRRAIVKAAAAIGRRMGNGT